MKDRKLVVGLLSAVLLAFPFAAKAQDMVRAVSNEGLEKVISYNVASFTDIRDKKLEDVIAKMPGMSISTSFTYNGMTVIKVFVNGFDILNGDISSIKSMKPEDVESIVITENYVYEKIMRGIDYSNSVAINIIMKEEAKSKWSGSIKGGAGVSSKPEIEGISPLLYNGEAQAMNIGQKVQTTLLLKADNTGLSFSSDIGQSIMGRVNSFLSVNPSLAPLTTQRTRLNNSAYGHVTSTFQLNRNLQLSLKLALHGDKLKAANSAETEYYDNDGSSFMQSTGNKTFKKQGDIKAEIVLLSNSESSFFKNELVVDITDQKGSSEITGTYPSLQNIDVKPFSVEDNLSFKKPVGHGILSIDMLAAYDSKPQYLTVDRDPFDLKQDILTDAFTEELWAAWKLKAGRLSFAVKLGANSKIWDLETQISPDVQEVKDATGLSDINNDSRFSYINLSSDVSLTYINDRFQFEVTTPLNYYRNFFKDNINPGARWPDGKNYNDRVHFAPKVSAKYQITDNLSVQGSASGLNNGLLGARLYNGLVLTDFKSFSQGNVNSQNDKSIVTSAGLSYRLPKQSFFVSGTFYRINMNQELLSQSKYTENYYISGYVPVEKGLGFPKSITNRYSLDMSKGIAALKGKVGVTGSMSTVDAEMFINNQKVPYTSNSYSIGANINGRLFSWLNTIYKATYTHSNLSMSGKQASRTNGLTQSLELIFSPAEKFNFSFLGDHFMNQIAADTYKNFFIVDFKAEYIINTHWELYASVTNLLNEKTYSYILESTFPLSKALNSYVIRPRNMMLGAFFKF
jgi:hypothetical protein